MEQKQTYYLLNLTTKFNFVKETAFNLQRLVLEEVFNNSTACRNPCRPILIVFVKVKRQAWSFLRHPSAV